MEPTMWDVIVPEGEPRVPPSLWDRPDWVMELGIYGRAAYEWRRARAPMSLDLLEDPVTMFRLIDSTVSDQVRRVVQDWIRYRADTSVTVDNLPPEFAETEEDQITAATRAAEIRPCLDLVFLPALPAPGDLIDGFRPSVLEVELLTTISWEQRPSLGELRMVALDLADELNERDLLGSVNSGECLPLTCPTALFPTEVRVVNQYLATLLYRPVDLYLINVI
ncbi:MAG: hypothetical protein ACFCVK_24915 [Acidimicrobiales bacterium]